MSFKIIKTWHQSKASVWFPISSLYGNFCRINACTFYEKFDVKQSPLMTSKSNDLTVVSPERCRVISYYKFQFLWTYRIWFPRYWTREWQHGLKWPSHVIQGHRTWYQSKTRLLVLLLVVYSNCRRNTHRFRDTSCFIAKNHIFFHFWLPHLYLTLNSKVMLLDCGDKIGARKLESWIYHMVEKSWSIVERCGHSLPVWQTDRFTMTKTALCIASRGKKNTKYTGYWKSTKNNLNQIKTHYRATLGLCIIINLPVCLSVRPSDNDLEWPLTRVSRSR